MIKAVPNIEAIRQAEIKADQDLAAALKAAELATRVVAIAREASNKAYRARVEAEIRAQLQK